MFSLILQYPASSNCIALDNANEGILLRAEDSFNISHFLHFYYNRNNRMSRGSSCRIPLVDFLSEDLLKLTYDNYATTVDVPGTRNTDMGLLDFSLNSSQLIDRIVRLTWEQHAQDSKGPDCDVWSLDNVAIVLHHNCGMRTVLTDDFNNQQ